MRSFPAPMLRRVDHVAVLQALLFGGGVWWCAHVLRRLRTDVRELRTTTDRAARDSLWMLWGVTLAIAALLVYTAISFAGRILR